MSRYGGSVVGELCTQTHTVNMCSFLTDVCDYETFGTIRLFWPCITKDSALVDDIGS